MGNTQGTTTNPANSQSAVQEQQQQVGTPVEQQQEIEFTEKDLEYIESREADDAYGEIRVYRIKNSGQPHPEDPTQIGEDFQICTKARVFDSKYDCEDYFNDVQEKKRLVHPHLVRLLKATSTTNSNFCTNIQKVDIAFEFISHSLETEILNRFKSKEFFDEISIFDLIEQVLSGIYYLGSQGITHGDISPKTILIDNYANFKITDIRFLTSGMCGYRKHLAGIETECFLAPELFARLRRQTLVDNEEIDQEKADVFSLGLVALAMATLQSVDGIYDFETYLVREEEIQNLLEIVKQTYSHSLYLLITSMLNHVDKRLDVESSLTLVDQIRSDQFNQDEYEKNRFQTENINSEAKKVDEYHVTEGEIEPEEQPKRSPKNSEPTDTRPQADSSPANQVNLEQLRLQEEQRLQQQLRDQQNQQNQQPQQQPPLRANTNKDQKAQKTTPPPPPPPQQNQNNQSAQPNLIDIEGRVREALIRSQQVSIKFENSPLRLFRDQLLADELYVPLDPQQASQSSINKSRHLDNSVRKNNQGLLANSNLSASYQQSQPQGKHIVYQPNTSLSYQSTKKRQAAKRTDASDRMGATNKWKI